VFGQGLIADVASLVENDRTGAFGCRARSIGKKFLMTAKTVRSE
jgi:hypothetical protein